MAVLFVGQALLAVAGASLPVTIVALVVFFTAFNLLEATLPSLVSKFAPAALKGTAVRRPRACSSWHVRRAARGRVAVEWHGAAAVFGFCLVLTAVWLAVSATMAAPPAYNQRSYSMGET